MAVHTCKPSTWAAEAGDTEYKVSLSYTELEVSLSSMQPVSNKGGWGPTPSVGCRCCVWKADARFHDSFTQLTREEGRSLQGHRYLREFECFQLPECAGL